MALQASVRPSILFPLTAYAVLTVLWWLKPEQRRVVHVARPPKDSAVVSQTAAFPGSESAALSAPEQARTDVEQKQQGKAEDHVGPGWWALFAKAGSQWVAHKDARLGAALSYYSVFSLGPLIIIAVAVAGLLYGQEAVRGEVTGALRGLLGETGAKAIEAMLVAASEPREGILAAAIGIGTLVFAAIGVVVQLKDALNTVWEVETPPGRGVWGFLRAYVLSFAGVLSLGFLLLISMLVTTALAAAGKYLGSFVPEAALQTLSFVVSFLVITLLFAMMFKWLPDTKVQWRDVWLGAALTAVLFEIGKFLIGFYIGKQGLESTYGAAASIVVVLIWVYYSAQIVLFGAEFTNARAKQRRAASPQMKLADKARDV